MGEILRVGVLSENMARTQEGYLVCSNVNISTTDPMEYVVDGVATMRTKPQEELLSSVTMASFEGKPITIDHPNGTFVDTGNWKELSVGFLRNVHGSGEFLVADLVITDQLAIDTVLKEGVREVSIGFTSDIHHDGDKTVMRNIRGNHLAIVGEGRAGSACSIIDSKGAVMGNKTNAVPEASQEADAGKDYQKGFIDGIKQFFGGNQIGAKQTTATVTDAVDAPATTGALEGIPTASDINARFDAVEKNLAEIQVTLKKLTDALLAPAEADVPATDGAQPKAPSAETVTDAKQPTYLPRHAEAQKTQSYSLADMQAERKAKGIK